MTRINCVPVSELTLKHLLAEYRELPRVFGLVKKAVSRKEKPTDPRFPDTYTLGKGHVLFFYPRLGYLSDRYPDLISELQRRGYRPKYQDAWELIDGIPDEWFGSWTPTPEAQKINRQRICERLNGRN